MPQTTPQQALEELNKLSNKLDHEAAVIEKFERYYEGKHNLRFATRKFREAFGALFREFASNFCGLVVDCPVERMGIDGFRFPMPGETEPAAHVAAPPPTPAPPQDAPPGVHTPPAAPPVPVPAPEPSKPPEPRVPTDHAKEGHSFEMTSDPDAWEIWQRNNLDLHSDTLHATTFICGKGYVIVGPQDDGTTDSPIITVEHPLEVVTSNVPGSPHLRKSALKRWWDEDTGMIYATLYLPDTIWKFESMKASKNGIQPNINWIGREGVSEVMLNPFNGVVPVVPFVNRQTVHGKGRSELQDVIPLQDALNKTYNDALVASEFAAFRQRILTGMEVPEDEQGNIIPDFDLKASVQRIMLIKDKEVGVHEFQVSDLGQYINLMEYIRDEIAAITRTPPQYLVGKVVNVSGDALKAAESGLVSKVKRRQKFFGESWEEVMRLAFLLKGDKRAHSYAAETIWQNPEVRTDSELADALAKFATLGIPLQALWERMGASQNEIQRWLDMRREEPVQLPERALAAMIQSSAQLGEP